VIHSTSALVTATRTLLQILCRIEQFPEQRNFVRHNNLPNSDESTASSVDFGKHLFNTIISKSGIHFV
jgi:hypothetical protein